MPVSQRLVVTGDKDEVTPYSGGPSFRHSVGTLASADPTEGFGPEGQADDDRVEPPARPTGLSGVNLVTGVQTENNHSLSNHR